MKSKYAVTSLPVPRSGVVVVNDRELARRMAKAMGIAWSTASINERASLNSLAGIATSYVEECCERAKVRYA